MRKIFCVSCMLILALSLAACSSDFDGSLIGNESGFIMDFTVLNKTYSQDLVVESGDAIRAKIAVEKGSISMKIQKDDEEPVYEGTSIFIPDEFDVEIDESGSYTVTVTGKKAKGSVSFNVESSQ